jgi:hypothetical protein
VRPPSKRKKEKKERREEETLGMVVSVCHPRGRKF